MNFQFKREPLELRGRRGKPLQKIDFIFQDKFLKDEGLQSKDLRGY